MSNLVPDIYGPIPVTFDGPDWTPEARAEALRQIRMGIAEFRFVERRLHAKWAADDEQ